MTRAQYILFSIAEQFLPYSTPGFANPHPKKTWLRKGAATKYADKLRSIQRERFFRKAISASWKSPKANIIKLPPSALKNLK